LCPFHSPGRPVIVLVGATPPSWRTLGRGTSDRWLNRVADSAPRVGTGWHQPGGGGERPGCRAPPSPSRATADAAPHDPPHGQRPVNHRRTCRSEAQSAADASSHLHPLQWCTTSVALPSLPNPPSWIGQRGHRRALTGTDPSSW
jgi:hypothetical protein